MRPIDGQDECGKAGRYLFTHEFTFWNPLDISISGVKMGGSFSIKDRLGNVLGECSFRTTIK